MAEFTDALAAEGVESRTTRATPHGDKRGGPLIQRAVAAAEGGRPVTGLVIQFERGVPATEATAVTPPVVDRMRRRVTR